MTQTNLPATQAAAPAVIERSVTVCEIEPLPTKVIVEQVKRIQEAMGAVMKPQVHYGTIPGCGDKPTLLKPGAEKICMMFRLHPELTVQREDLPGSHREYTITVALKDPNGHLMGQGVGSCSTLESKYRWRTAAVKCPACGASAIRRSKFAPKEGGAPGWYCADCKTQYAAEDAAIVKQPRGKVENPDIADTYNTVLKMAKKRAQVDATLTATAASDIFTQDVEDLAGHESGYEIEAVTVAPAVEPKPAPTNGHNGTAPRKPAANERIEADLSPDLYKLEAPRSSHRGKTLAEIHASDPAWIPAALQDAKRRAACTKRDVANLAAYWEVMEQADAQRACAEEFDREATWAEAAKIEAEASHD